MTIETRLTHNFAEISVDEISETIFFSDKDRVDEIICNLLIVADELSSKTDKSVTERLRDFL